MTEHIREFTHFLGIEKENELKTLLLLSNDFYLLHELDFLFRKCLTITLKDVKHKIPAFLFMNVHREFYLSMGNFLSLHGMVSFRNLRSAIDSALTAYYLLEYPDSREVYLSGLKAQESKEWNKKFKNIKKTVRDDLGTFNLAKGLCEIHEFCSLFCHSDAVGIMTRYIEDKEKLRMEAQYFDYEKTNDGYRKWYGCLLRAYFEIFVVFWKKLFEEISSGESSTDISARINTFQQKLTEFIDKYPLNAKSM